MKSKKNGNSIFLPAAGSREGSELYDAGNQGFYWSSSLDTASSAYAYVLGFNSGYPDWLGGNRYFGLPVRPVRP